jgi:hypothetical protein
VRPLVARFGDPAGVEQEMWSLLTLYQALRIVMVDAAESRPKTDPDRCSFTVALNTARDHVVQAAGFTDTGPVGAIAHKILAALLPAGRPRVSTRKVKSPISRYAGRHDDGRPDTSRPVTDLHIAVLEPPAQERPLPTTFRDDRHTAAAERRRYRILALREEDPTRLWQPRDIAAHFGDVTLHTMYRQLSRWTVSGLIHKIGPGLYAATTWTPTPVQATGDR